MSRTERFKHRLFRDFPIDGSVRLSAGEVPTPYVVYDGHGLLVAGTADLAAVERHAGEQDVFPVATASGRALMGIIICDFPDASHGSHHELQVFVLVSQTKRQMVRDHAFGLPAWMARRKDWGTLCLHLWNDSHQVVAYNREYLGLNAQLCESRIGRSNRGKTFEFRDPSGKRILSGDVTEEDHQSLRSALELSRLMGLRALLSHAFRPYHEGAVINLKGAVFTDNRRAPTYTAPDTVVLQHFDPERDVFRIHDVALAKYRFNPQSLEHLIPFRFAYLRPGGESST